MELKEKTISEFLFNLGLGQKEVRIYLVLLKHGSLTTLKLSRLTKLPRTSVYRLLERLKNIGVVEEVIDQKKTKAKAVDIDRLKILLQQKELEVEQLKNLFPQVASFLSKYQMIHQEETKVLFYRGREGVRQMAWNVLSLKDKFQGYTYRRFEEIVGEDFCREWGIEFLKRGLFGRDVYSDEYLKSKKAIKTSVLEKLFAGKKCWQSRYIPAKILNIDHQLDIYNDVVSFYNWHKGEIFGVEIYNEKIAKLQKQIFEIIWKMAKPHWP